MLFPSKYLTAAIIIHGCIGCFEELMAIFFAKASVPLGKFYNDSMTLHYGISLGPEGVVQAMTVMMSVQMIGSILSLFFILPKMDSYGRKTVAIWFRSGLAILAVIFMLIGKLVLSVEVFALGAILLGAVGPIKIGVTRFYVSECSPDEIRGFVTQGLSAITGIMILLFTALYMPDIIGNDARWHYTFYIAGGIIFAFFIGALFIPESPKFLWFNQKKAEAIRAIRAFHGEDANIESITDSYEHERTILQSKNAHQITVRELLSDDGLRDSLLLVFLTTMVTVIGPLQLNFLFSIPLKIQYGFTNSQALTFELITSFIFLPLSYALPFLYEKVGRRPVFLFNTFLSLSAIVFMFLANCAFELQGQKSSWITLASTIIFTLLLDLGNALGLMTFGVILIADLLPASAKIITIQVLMFITALISMAFVYAYSFLQPILGFYIYFPIIGAQLFMLLYLYRNLPETRRKAVYQNFEEVMSRAQTRRNSLSLMRSRASTYKYGAV